MGNKRKKGHDKNGPSPEPSTSKTVNRVSDGNVKKCKSTPSVNLKIAIESTPQVASHLKKRHKEQKKYLNLKKIKENVAEQQMKKEIDCSSSETNNIDEDLDVMEWEPIESEVITSLQEYRKITHLNEQIQYPNIVEHTRETPNGNCIGVVVDTNIFLCHLPTVKMLMESQEFSGKIKVYVPWTVLQELDYMKTKQNDKSKLEVLARRAGNLIYEYLKAPNCMLRVQTLQEYKDSTAKLPIESNADDKILQWCVDLQINRQKPVILLSNDVNLCTKALACGVQAFLKEHFVIHINSFVNASKPSYPLENSKSLPQQQSRSCSRNDSVNSALKNEAAFLDELEACLLEPMSKLLQREMQKVYEGLWKDIVLIKPPWKFSDVIRCIEKHWIAVFSYIYPKSWRDGLNHLKSTLYTSKSSLLTKESQEAVLEKSKDLLRTAQTCTKECRSEIQHCLKSLDNMILRLRGKTCGSSEVPDLLTKLWTYLNSSCARILDAAGIQHSLPHEPLAASPSGSEVECNLTVLLSALPPLETLMSKFLANLVDEKAMQSSALELAACLISINDQLHLDLVAELSLNRDAIAHQLIRFVKVDTGNCTVMQNGLNQLRTFRQSLIMASDRLCAFHS